MGMVCPQCRTEYRAGFFVCADCGVSLVPGDVPVAASEEPGTEAGRPSADDDPFCEFWKGSDPRLHAELCSILRECGVPYRSFRHEDHLFNIAPRDAFRIGIPFSQFDKAEAAVQAVFGDSPEAPETARRAPAALPPAASRGHSSAKAQASPGEPRKPPSGFARDPQDG